MTVAENVQNEEGDKDDLCLGLREMWLDVDSDKMRIISEAMRRMRSIPFPIFCVRCRNF